MAEFETERDRVAAARERLDGWLYRARDDAFTELFEGTDPLLTAEELRVLDAVDSRLSRSTGRGLWDADEYGVGETGVGNGERTPRVVATRYPRLPGEAFPGDETLEAGTRERLNDALWQYAQRVAEHAQAELDAFVSETEVVGSGGGR